MFLPGHTAGDIVPNPIEETNTLSNAKKDDVKKLLIKHYGENGFHLPELQFFVGSFERSSSAKSHQEENNLLCEAADEDQVLVV